MTLEEQQAQIEAQNQKIQDLEARTAEAVAKNEEWERRFSPPQNEDDAYKPGSWKELDEKVDRKAQEMAMKVLKEAEEEKDRIRREDEESQSQRVKEIEEKIQKLQEEGVIEETKGADDLGARQRSQIIGLALKTGGTDVESAARMLRTAWDQGIEYDFKENSFRTKGRDTSFRDAPVGSSASRTPAPARKGPISVAGLRGDLDEAQRRWEEANK